MPKNLVATLPMHSTKSYLFVPFAVLVGVNSLSALLTCLAMVFDFSVAHGKMGFIDKLESSSVMLSKASPFLMPFGCDFCVHLRRSLPVVFACGPKDCGQE